MTAHAPVNNIKTDTAVPATTASMATTSVSTKPVNELATAPPTVTQPEPVPAHIAEEKVTLLESTFNTIYKERMHDVPIINDKIEVHVVGFQQWQKSYLCIMITPWFMNIMLLPGETENWDEKRETASSTHTFPSGSYTFLVGFEPGIGKYQMCSLFSPMFEFADNDAAVETAEVAIKELMNIENVEETDINSRQIEAIWDGTEEHPDKIAAREEAEKIKAEAPPRMPLKERMQQPVSRRQLLRGAIMLEDDEGNTAKK